MAGLKLKNNFTLIWVLVGLLIVPVLAAAADTEKGEFSMSIMDVFSISGQGTILTGQVVSGFLVVGDAVCIPLKNGETAARTVEGIEMFRKFLDRAEKGQVVGVLVQIDKKLVEWVASGKLKYRETIVEGLERAPEYFNWLFEGKSLANSLFRSIRTVAHWVSLGPCISCF